MRELSLHRTALQSYKPDPRRRGTTVKTTRALAALVAVLGLLVLPVTAVAQARYSPVTDQRLVTPEPENWLQIRGNYQGWGYSPLSQITTGNVRRLTPVWAFSTGVDSGHEAPPLVNNGVMFVPTPYSQVIALDAKNGKLLWRYKRELPEDFKALHNTSRGIALYGDKVYVASLDCHLVALDAKTGKQVWSRKVEDYKTGYYMTLAPLVAKGKVMVGVSGGEFGVRGFVQAFDAQSGEPVWKTYTVPAPGGDNLYTSSTVALDPATGMMKGHFQYQWNESWDWDEPDAPLVIDYQKDGRTIKGLVHPARNGYLYLLERSRERIGFVSATAYVKQNVFRSVDQQTGRPAYHEERIPKTGKRAEFCPSLWGGKDWPNAAYNPKMGRLFIPANDNHCGFMEGKVQQYVAGQWWTGVDIPDIGFTVDKGAKYFGEIQAWDVNSGKRAWSHQYPDSMSWGGVLTTGSGLVFAGGTNDRHFRAFDASSGKVLWQFTTNSGIIAPPSSFAVDGVQYVSVVSGWGVDPAFQQGLLGDLLGWPKDVPQGGVIWVFAVSK